MHLKQLKLVNFLNYAHQQVSFDPSVNLIYGDNGSGKTNLLDTINFLGLSRSYFGTGDKNLVRDGEDYYRVEGIFHKEGKDHAIVIKYRTGGGKEIEMNNQELSSAADLVGLFPVVFVAPDDIRLVYDTSQIRRRFMDRILCQADRSYLNSILKYNRILRQKNAHLKSEGIPNRKLVETFNQKMIPLAEYLFQCREDFVDQFTRDMLPIYEEISGGREEIGLHYRSQLGRDRESAQVFFSVIDQEIRKRRPLAGIQLDDLEFVINGRPLKKFGSQGQIKSFIYALRLSEFRLLERTLAEVPILILDDFFEKLDQKRLRQLMGMLNNQAFDQVFLSDTELARSQAIFSDGNVVFSSFHAVNGSLADIQ